MIEVTIKGRMNVTTRGRYVRKGAGWWLAEWRVDCVINGQPNEGRWYVTHGNQRRFIGSLVIRPDADWLNTYATH